MVFKKSLLIAALATAISSAQAAEPVCKIQAGSWNELKISGQPIGVTHSGDVVVGGAPHLFSYAVCNSKTTGTKAKNQAVEGYIVDAYNTTQCLSLGKKEAQSAPITLSPCRFNKQGHVVHSQTFAWIPNGPDAVNATAYFKGVNDEPISKKSPPKYTLHYELQHPGLNGQLGRLMADYTPNLKALPEGQLTLSLEKHTGELPAKQAVLNCTEIIEGQLIYSNATARGNTYTGPLNAIWEADAKSADKFLLQKCDYSSLGFAETSKYAYGRLRPAADQASGFVTCYSMEGPLGGSGPTAVPARRPHITSIVPKPCTFNVAAGRELVRYNKQTKTVKFVPYPHLRRTGSLYWYTQADYDKNFRVEQKLTSPKSIGQAYLDHDNVFLTKFRPGNVTFQADPVLNAQPATKVEQPVKA